MKIRIYPTETEFSFIEKIALAMYFIFEINVELIAHKSLYVAVVLFLFVVMALFGRFRLPVNQYFMWTVFWMFVVLISVLYSIAPSTTFTAVLTLGARALAFLSIFSRVRTKELLRSVLKILLVVEFVNVLYVLSQIDITMLGSKRIGALMNMDSDVTWNSNTLSGVLSVCVIAALALLRNHAVKYRGLTIITTLFYSVLILLSGSRQGLLILVGVPLTYLLLSSNYKNALGRVVMIAAVMLVTYFVIMKIPPLYNMIGRRMEALIQNMLNHGSSDLSIAGRVKLINYGLNWILESPVWGHGMYTFKEQLQMSYGYEMYAHNNYIEVLFGTGLIGLAAYYSLHISMLLRSFRIRYPHWQIVVSSLLIMMGADMVTVSFKKFAFQFALLVLSLLMQIGIQNTGYDSIEQIKG